jgi:beta-glucanase (GH16 family)
MPMATGGKRKGSNLSPAQKILRQKTMPPFRSGEVVRPENPRLLKDLGRDYSRYPSSRSSSMPPSRRATTSLDSRVTLLRTTTNNPFSDSQADLDKYGFPDDSIGAFDPYFGGEKGFILYENEVEEDDKWHVPADDDDVTFKPNWREYWDRRQMVSFVGGLFLIFGLLSIFIILPVLTFATNIYLPGGMLQSNSSSFIDYGPAWAHVTNRTFALLKNVRAGLIDPTTPTSAKTRTSTFDGSTLNLVFSDEFNGENRTFYPGDDPFWTAPNIWYGATQDMEWYDPVAVTTGDGTLQLTLSAFPNHGLQYMSGMLNSWNQLCFKGGVFEVSVSLPGPVVPGLWPGCWTLGNIGRPGYKATTEGTWPYTYQACDAGITPNQSSPDGMNFLPGQKLSSCTCKGEDHPNPGTGRGAPEIDILEAAVEPANLLGVVTQSYQVAPFDIFWRPNSNFLQIPNYETTQMNGYCGGPYQQAVSATTLLNPNWYNGTAYQKYAFEYIPGGPGTGKIAWFVGEDQSFMMDGRAIGPNGNVAARPVSQEPMSMVLNLGMSSAWGEVDIPNLIFPTVMNIDYVRIYQRPGHESITCDPPGYPTTEYIANHPKAYNNPNLTVSLFPNYNHAQDLTDRRVGVKQTTRGRKTT